MRRRGACSSEVAAAKADSLKAPVSPLPESHRPNSPIQLPVARAGTQNLQQLSSHGPRAAQSTGCILRQEWEITGPGRVCGQIPARARRAGDAHGQSLRATNQCFPVDIGLISPVLTGNSQTLQPICQSGDSTVPCTAPDKPMSQRQGQGSTTAVGSAARASRGATPGTGRTHPPIPGTPNAAHLQPSSWKHGRSTETHVGNKHTPNRER